MLNNQTKRNRREKAIIELKSKADTKSENKAHPEVQPNYVNRGQSFS